MTLELQDIAKSFPKRDMPFGLNDQQRQVLSGISFDVRPGCTLGLIGESGAGKSTLARIALGLTAPSSGRVLFEGADIASLSGRDRKRFRQSVQPVFQDAAGALDPRLTVASILSEPLELRGIPRPERRERAVEALRLVELPSGLLARRPCALSGGQRQRIGLARALLMEPAILVLDEPVSALDVLIQAQVLNLLKDLQEQRNLGYLFIGHDLAVAEFFCNEIAVLQDGRIVEHAASTSLFSIPQHGYTQSLIAASLAVSGDGGE